MPPAFAYMARRLASLPAPEASPGLGAAWEARYEVHSVHREPLGAWTGGVCGGLRLRRGATAAGRFGLDVGLWLGFPGPQSDRISAQLTCKDDGAGSLLRWRRHSQLASRSAPSLNVPVRDDGGGYSSGRLVRKPGPPLAAPPPLVPGWALFDTLRRLNSPLSFTMLEELDAVRPGQTLRPYRDAEVTMRGRAVRLRGWLQTGPGILPTTWWLHESGVPLLVLAGLRAYVYNPSAAMQEVTP
jgi:hypothetical protein